jgi:flagellar protein FliS
MQTQNYKHNLIMCASPMELIMMLYDEAIMSLSKAESAFAIEEPHRIQEISNKLIHAQDIITELAVSLDMEKGGEIAQHLHRLYDFMLNHLARANASKSTKPISEVRDLLCELRESWKQVAAQEPQRVLPTSGTQMGNIVISG